MNSAHALLPSGRRHTITDRRNAVSFATGALLGALAMTPVVLVAQGLVSPVPAPVRNAIWALVALVIMATGLIAAECPLPQTRRQLGRDVAPFPFGAALGTGVMTYAPSCAPHTLALSLVLLRPPFAIVLAALVGFGAGRGTGLLAAPHDALVAVCRRGGAVAITLTLVLVEWRSLR